MPTETSGQFAPHSGETLVAASSVPAAGAPGGSNRRDEPPATDAIVATGRGAIVPRDDTIRRPRGPGTEPAGPGVDRGTALLLRPMLLASSWTWLIGMYLPVLLLDQYGPAGVLAFAIPNVCGVMLFGIMLGRLPALRRLPATHPWMPVLFSLVVVAFHGFVLVTLWRREVDPTLPDWVGFAPMSIVFVMALLTMTLPERWIVRAGAAAWCVSAFLLLAAIVAWFLVRDLPVPGATGWQRWFAAMFDLIDGPRPAKWMPASENPLMATLFLTPIMIFGFLLCPYLDLTFHRSYQAVGGGRRGAATFIMFGVFFSVMIGFTAIYAVLGFGPAVALHILLQSWITVTLHLRELDRAPRPLRPGGGLLLALAALFVGLIVAHFAGIEVYREWFVFWGLIFPAWLLLTVLKPALLKRQALGRVQFAGVCLLCAPFLAWGILRPDQNAVIAVPVVILAAAFFVGRRLPEPSSAPSM